MAVRLVIVPIADEHWSAVCEGIAVSRVRLGPQMPSGAHNLIFDSPKVPAAITEGKYEDLTTEELNDAIDDLHAEYNRRREPRGPAELRRER